MEAVSLLLLSTADTDLLAARAVEDPALPLRLANPVRLDAVDLEGVQLVVVRLLGGRRAWDGLDALLADASSRGVPVVAVAEGGLRETVEDEHTGFLVTGPPRSMAKALTRLLEDDTLAQKMAVESRRVVERRWAGEIAIDTLLGHLEQVAEGTMLGSE